jgi:hypothetical protein
MHRLLEGEVGLPEGLGGRRRDRIADLIGLGLLVIVFPEAVLFEQPLDRSRRLAEQSRDRMDGRPVLESR